MPKVAPTNVVRLAAEVTAGVLKLTDVHPSLKHSVQRVLDSGAVAHMTKSTGKPESRTRFVGPGTRKARTV